MSQESRGGPTFRFAGPGDVDEVVALVQSSYRGEGSREGWTTEADWIDGQRTDAAEVSELVGSSPGGILLADDGARLVGSCQLNRWAEGVAYFGMFAVRPDLQGRGIGRALIAEAERIAASEWGDEMMRMGVLDVRHDLIAFYERLGYRPTGEHEPFPYGNPAYGLPRVDDLRFAVLVKPLKPTAPPA